MNTTPSQYVQREESCVCVVPSPARAHEAPGSLFAPHSPWDPDFDLNEAQVAFQDGPDEFFPDLGWLKITLSRVVPDNQCHSSGMGGRFATAAYKAWLREYAPQLDSLLGDWQPDTSRWWAVAGEVYLDSRSDAPNLQKAALDLLSGSYVDDEGKLDPASGRIVGKGRIRKPGALWDDDRRVRTIRWDVMMRRCAEPFVVLHVVAAPEGWEPPDSRAMTERLERQKREAIREEKRAAALAVREEKREAKLRAAASRREQAAREGAERQAARKKPVAATLFGGASGKAGE